MEEDLGGVELREIGLGTSIGITSALHYLRYFT